MSQQINLFNPALQKTKQIFTSATMLSALGLLMVGVIAIGFIARQNVLQLEAELTDSAERLEKAKATQARAIAEFVPRKKSAALQAEIDQAQAALRSLHEIELVLKGGAMGDTSGYAEYFRALARQSSGQVWLTGVSIAGAGREIGLRGRATQADAVPAYIGRLTREPILQGRTFGSLVIDRPQLGAADAKADSEAEEAPFVQFSLQAEAAAKTAGVAP